MELSQQTLDSIVEGLPDWRLAPPDVAEIAATLDDERLGRTHAAATMLARLWPAASARRRSAGTQLITFGFMAVEMRHWRTVAESYPRVSANGFTFGVSILSRAPMDGMQQIGEPIVFLDRRFPVVTTHGRVELHKAPPHAHPSGCIGSSACWTKPRATHTASWTHGIITARHVVAQLSLGNSMALDPTSTYGVPTRGTLAEIDDCTIDAAVVEIDPGDWPAGLSVLGVRDPRKRAVPPGASVDLDGRTTRASGRILRAHQDTSYFGNMFGQRIVMDRHGASGDSGALVLQAGGGDGFGIYMGRIPDGHGGYEGLCQDLFQVADYFDLDLYR